MLPNYRKKANNCIGAALVLSVLGFVLAWTSLAPIGLTASLSALPIFALGCCSYAKAKGHHWAWGLLGFTTIPGLIVLMLFTDRHPEKA